MREGAGHLENAGQSLINAHRALVDSTTGKPQTDHLDRFGLLHDGCHREKDDEHPHKLYDVERRRNELLGKEGRGCDGQDVNEKRADER